MTTDIEEYANKLEELISFGYTKIQIHSSSPNEGELLNQISKILPSDKEKLLMAAFDESAGLPLVRPRVKCPRR